MSDEEKLLWMFEQVHGKMTGSCYVEVSYDTDANAEVVKVMKDGNLCWLRTKSDLVFEYLTKDL